LVMLSEAVFEMIFKFSTTPGTTWCYRPLYSPSVFYLIVTRSTPSYGVFTPSIDLQGRTFANKFNFFLKVTLSDLKPLPIGVSNGPLRPYLYFLTASID
jgi:hypothetical protein